MQDRLRYRFWDNNLKEYSDVYCVGANGFNVDGVVPEQCTGFKDRLGNLVYEGDVLKDKYGYYCWVVWDYNGFWVKSLGSEAMDFESQEFYESSEIVGNIHENGDIL